MRKEGQQVHIPAEGMRGADFIIRFARWNAESVAGAGLIGAHLMCDVLGIRENQPHAAPVGRGRAVGSVVHLKDELRPGGNELGVTFAER